MSAPTIDLLSDEIAQAKGSLCPCAGFLITGPGTPRKASEGSPLLNPRSEVRLNYIMRFHRGTKLTCYDIFRCPLARTRLTDLQV